MSLNNLKFVANVAVDFTDFPELGQVRKAFDDRNNYSHKSSDGFTLATGSNTDFVFTGHDIKYALGVPLLGTLSSFDIFKGNVDSYDFSKFSMSIAESVPVFGNASQGVLEKLFQGNNSIIGSNEADTLQGYAGNDNLKGNAGNDKIKGSGGDDKINGGTGLDILFANGGNNQFVFNSALGPDNVDRIQDFDGSDDSIKLATSVFVGLNEVNGRLDPQQFVVGTGPVGTGPQLIYNQTTGALSYDSDGTGPTAAIQFATLDAGTALTANDILL